MPIFTVQQGYGLNLTRSFRFQTTTCTHLQVEITEIQHTCFLSFFLSSFFLSFFLSSFFFLSFFLSFFLFFLFLSFFLSFLSFFLSSTLIIFIYCTILYIPKFSAFESVLNFIKQFFAKCNTILHVTQKSNIH